MRTVTTPALSSAEARDCPLPLSVDELTGKGAHHD